MIALISGYENPFVSYLLTKGDYNYKYRYVFCHQRESYCSSRRVAIVIFHNDSSHVDLNVSFKLIPSRRDCLSQLTISCVDYNITIIRNTT